MKNLLMLLVCMIFVSFSFGQKSNEETPAAAKSAFAAKFPAAKKVKWSVEKPGEFEVEFLLDKVESSALYDSDGRLIESENEIEEADLPQSIKTTLTKDFAGYKTDDVEKATDGKGIITYEMVASKGRDKLELSFDAEGKLLSKESYQKEGKEENEN